MVTPKCIEAAAQRQKRERKKFWRWVMLFTLAFGVERYCHWDTDGQPDSPRTIVTSADIVEGSEADWRRWYWRLIWSGDLVDAFPDSDVSLFLSRAVYEHIRETIAPGLEADECDIVTSLGWRLHVLQLFLEVTLSLEQAYLDRACTVGTPDIITGRTVWVFGNPFGGLTLIFAEDYDKAVYNRKGGPSASEN